MAFGLILFVAGYALFYWGWHHMPGQQNRYSLWYLLGFGSVFKNVTMPAGQPVQFKTSANIQGQGAGTSTGQGGSQSPSNAKTKSGLSNPVPSKQGLRIGRTDQGVDWSGSGPLYAAGSGTIINVYNPGWPNGIFIVLRLDNPPAGIPSPDIYYAEDIVPAVGVGQHVNAGDLIGRATGGSSGIELGFANPNAIGAALGWQWGQAFRNWISGLPQPYSGA